MPGRSWLIREMISPSHPGSWRSYLSGFWAELGSHPTSEVDAPLMCLSHCLVITSLNDEPSSFKYDETNVRLSCSTSLIKYRIDVDFGGKEGEQGYAPLCVNFVMHFNLRNIGLQHWKTTFSAPHSTLVKQSIWNPINDLTENMALSLAPISELNDNVMFSTTGNPLRCYHMQTVWWPLTRVISYNPNRPDQKQCSVWPHPIGWNSPNIEELL